MGSGRRHIFGAASLDGENLTSLVACKNHLEHFIAKKHEKFWKDGIMKLPQRWQMVVEENGVYAIE